MEENTGSARWPAFAEVVQQSVHEYLSRHWREVSPATLAAWTQAYSRDSLTDRRRDQYVSLHTLFLQEYFNGPKNPADKVLAHHSYVLGALDIAEDPSEFAAAITIMNFANSDLPGLHPRGDFFGDITTFSDRGIHDLDTYTKAGHAQKVAITLWKYLFPDREPPLLNAQYAEFHESTRRVEKLKLDFDNFLVDKYKVLRATTMLDELRKYRLQSAAERGYLVDAIMAGEDVESLIPEWLVRAIFKTNDPVAFAFDHKYGPLLQSLNRTVQKRFELSEHGYPLDGIMHIPFGRNVVIDVMIPKGLGPVEKEIVLQAIVNRMKEPANLSNALSESRYSEIAALNYRGVYPTANLSANVSQYIPELTKPVISRFRERVEFDDLRIHPLSRLAAESLPVDVTDTEPLIADILENFVRVVPRRGVRFKITDPALRAAGVEQITCKRGRSLEDIDTVMRFRGDDIPYTLTNFQIQEKRKYFSSLLQVHRAQLLTLRLLHEWMTRPAIDTREGAVTGESHGVTDGGQLRYLGFKKDGSPKNWRQPQRDLYFIEGYGKDLAEESIKRRAEDPTGRRRNSTWIGVHENDGVHRVPLIVYVAKLAVKER